MYLDGYLIEGFYKFNRCMNTYQRGEFWRSETPDKYGILFTGIKVPTWSVDAMGYAGNQDAFATYPEGDLYDGIEDGHIDVDLVHMLNAQLVPFKRNEALLLLKQKNRWLIYKGDGKRISSWLELRIGKKPDKKPLKTFENLTNEELSTALEWHKEEKFHQEILKNRLIIYLNNTQANLRRLKGCTP